MWVEKYRPKTIKECILPENIKNTLISFIKNRSLPNLLLSGSSGVGKTASVLALCDELNASMYFINGSNEGRFLDTIRNNALSYASTRSVDGSKKILLIDEADNTTNDVQLLLRASIEKFQNNCIFILTCNNKNKIIPAIQSRCSNIEYIIKGSDKSKLALQFMRRIENILKENNIDYDKEVLVEIIKSYFPDWRRILNECESYSSNGRIDTGILSVLNETSIDDLFKMVKDKKFGSIKKWVFSNVDLEFKLVMRKIFDNAEKYLEPSSVPSLILLIAKYQEQVSRVADKEIHLLAFFVEMIVECEFK